MKKGSISIEKQGDVMDTEWNSIGEGGLTFFGKMSASVSHEIKNALAIINESAGLLEDLALMAEKGIPVDPQRLKSHAGKIVKQVWRADGIVKNMNKFAHSVDEPLKSIDIGEAAALVLALSGRLAAMRGVALEVCQPPAPIMIHTNPFFFQNLLFLCLDFSMDAAGSGKTVLLRIEGAHKDGRVSFTGLGGLEGCQGKGFPGEREKALLRVLGAGLTFDARAGEMVLTLSGR